MKSIIWKELRENARWALLGMAGLAASIVFVLWDSIAISRHPNQAGTDLAEDEFVMITIIGFPIVACALGLLQTIVETRRDQWAFLIHRPVSMTRIFLGKVAAGLALYAIATMAPFVAAAVWVAVPGHVAEPFYWPLVLPGIADMLAGVGFYFAGLIVGLRQARWLGSRLFPILAPILGCMLTFGMQQFWVAVLLTASLTIAMALAAWGCFTTAGACQRQTLWAKVPLGLSLTWGICVVGGILIGIGVSMFGPEHSGWRQYTIDRDGHILSYRQRGAAIVEIEDLDEPGNPLYAEANYLHRKDRYWLNQRQLGMTHLSLDGDWSYYRGYRRRERFYTDQLRHSYQLPNIRWIYSHADRLLLAYDLETRRRVRCFGPDGLTSGPELPAHRFDDRIEQNNWSGNVLAFPAMAYWFNPWDETLQQILVTGPEDPIIAVTPHSFRFDNTSRFLVFVCTEQTLRAFEAVDEHKVDQPAVNRRGLPVRLNPIASLTVPAPYDAQKHGQVMIGWLPQRDSFIFKMTHSHRKQEGRFRQMPEQVIEIASDGTTLRDIQLQPLNQIVQPSLFAVVPVAALVPPGFTVTTMVARSLLARLQGQPAQSWTRQFKEEPVQSAVFLATMLLAGLISMGLMIRLTAHYGYETGQRRAWAVAGFLLGFTGVVMFFCMRQLPARESCTSCGRRRVVSRESCEHCGEAFAPPELDGTEIFAA